MVELFGFEVENPVVYAAVNVIIWVGMFSLISIVFGDGPLDSVIPGLFGGFFFGLFGWYLQNPADN